MTFAIGYHQHVLSALFWLKAIVLQPNLPLASTGLLLSCSRAMAGAHMSAQEVAAMDRMHKKGEPPKDIIAKLVEARAKKGAAGPSPSAVYRFLAGVSYKREAAEKHGRKRRLP